MSLFPLSVLLSRHPGHVHRDNRLVAYHPSVVPRRDNVRVTGTNSSSVPSSILMRRLPLKDGWGSRSRVSLAPHPAFRIFTPFKGFFFLPPRPALRLFAPSTVFLLLLCAQLADLTFGRVVLGRVGAHRRAPPSHALARCLPCLDRSLSRGRDAQTRPQPRYSGGK